MELSVVVTLYNEEENIQPLLKAINSALVKYPYEIILVDDGSTDRTVAQVKQHADHHVKLVVLNNNYGQTAAMASGIATATGDYIVTMDGDLQDDARVIPFVLEMGWGGSPGG